MPSAYIIANVTVTNADPYDAYRKWSCEAIMVVVEGV